MRYTKLLTLFIVAAIIKAGKAIRNGNSATIEEFPWQVSVRDYIGHICGGAILSEIFVVTSAHCVSDESLPRDNRLFVLSGTNDRRVNNDQFVHQVLFKLIHENFNYRKNHDDIALLKMKRPFSFSLQRQKIKLPSETLEIPLQSSLLVSGWGQIDHSNPILPDELKKLDTIYYGTILNAIKLMKKFPQFTVEDKRIYTFEDRESGVSIGDSGGAVSYTTIDGNKILVGIVERFFPASEDKNGKQIVFPDIHTDVRKYVEWIKRNMDIHENSVLRD